jgi:hypothetical protein
VYESPIAWRKRTRRRNVCRLVDAKASGPWSAEVEERLPVRTVDLSRTDWTAEIDASHSRVSALGASPSEDEGAGGQA